MSKQVSSYNEEHEALNKVINFRFPHTFKKVGIIGAVSVLAYLFAYKFIGSNTLLTKDLLRTLILLFLFVASLSKEKIEDEYTVHIRFQSYIVAFIVTAIYAIVIPFVGFFLEIIIRKITNDGVVNLNDVSAFEVLFMMMAMQLLFFTTLKRFGRC
jgi:hypothetical protein